MLIISCKKDIEKLKKLVDDGGHGETWVQAYKYVRKNGWSPMQTRAIRYETGKECVEPNACTNVNLDCAEGINLATWQWCQRESSSCDKVIVIRFQVKYIAAIPVDCFGRVNYKFRVFKCKVIGDQGWFGSVWEYIKTLPSASI